MRAATLLLSLVCATACAQDEGIDSRWSIGVESSYLFNTIPNPF